MENYDLCSNSYFYLGCCWGDVYCVGIARYVQLCCGLLPFSTFALNCSWMQQPAVVEKMAGVCFVEKSYTFIKELLIVIVDFIGKRCYCLFTVPFLSSLYMGHSTSCAIL